MKDRYLIRYSGLGIGIISGLLVPKILFSYLDEGIVAQALLALGMGALFAVVDLGTSRHFYSRLASLNGSQSKSEVVEAFGVVSFSAVLATSLSFVIIFGVNAPQANTLPIALVAAMGALSVTLPWYKNLLDGAQLFRRGELVLFVRRLQPLLFTGFVVLGTGLGTGSILTGIVIFLGVWLLFDRPKVTNVRAAANEYLSFIRIRSARFNSMVWSISENLIYNSPMWFAFFFLPVEQQGVFIILIRIYNFLISVVRAPIEIVFLQIRHEALAFADLKRATIVVTARSFVVIILLGGPIIPIVPPLMDFITNGKILATFPEVLSFYFLVVAATVMHPLGLAATSFPEILRWAKIGSSLTVVFLFASVLIDAFVFGLTVSRLLLLFGAAIMVNALYLLIKFSQNQAGPEAAADHR